MTSAIRCLLLAIVPLVTPAPWSAFAGPRPAEEIRIAQAGNISEKEAFEAAKELGTVEAWKAFLENFPTGFRADLARAYVRRLAAEKTAPETAPPQPVEAQPQTPPAAPSPVLETVDLGPGTGSWSRGTYPLDEGNSTAPAAIVQANGVRLTAYCTGRRTVPIMISGEPRDEYPEFDERLQQGLAAAGAQPGSGEIVEIPMRFAGGQLYHVRALVHGLTGEMMLGDTPDGFAAYSPVLETIMAGETVTVSAPPFSATFQLNGSRAAICGILRQCGLATAQPGCS